MTERHGKQGILGMWACLTVCIMFDSIYLYLNKGFSPGPMDGEHTGRYWAFFFLCVANGVVIPWNVVNLILSVKYQLYCRKINKENAPVITERIQPTKSNWSWKDWFVLANGIFGCIYLYVVYSPKVIVFIHTFNPFK